MLTSKIRIKLSVETWVWFLPKLLKSGIQQGPSFRGGLARTVQLCSVLAEEPAASQDTLQSCVLPSPSVFHLLGGND